MLKMLPTGVQYYWDICREPFLTLTDAPTSASSSNGMKRHDA
jgi:hypothetical protein